ncbi:MAG TPA: hypothetical protein VHD56_02515 [Tepidisphaeraceae bacterium]|nr:hypothetical protein [Tepidisphaeraceae bacterium]
MNYSIRRIHRVPANGVVGLLVVIAALSPSFGQTPTRSVPTSSNGSDMPRATTADPSQSVESIVVRVQKDVDEFSRLGDRIGVSLPADFKDRIKRLRELANKGQSDATVAADYHAERSELISTLAAAMNKTLGDRDSVRASLNSLAASIQGAQDEVGEMLNAAETDARTNKESASLRQSELHSISIDARKVIAAGKTLPTEVQHRILLAEQHKQIAEQCAATAELKARLLRDVSAQIRALNADLVQRRNDLDRYYLWVAADRRTLDALAEIGGAQTELADLSAVLVRLRRQTVGSSPATFAWRPMLDWSEFSQPSSAATQPVVETNSDDVLAIISRNAAANEDAVAKEK